MTLDALEAQVDQYRAEANSTSNAFARQAKDIDRDPNLSDEGRKSAKAEINTAARESLRTLSRKETDAINMKVRDLEKQIDSKMGSTASDIIAFRDAQDRAERFDDQDEARRVLERAIRSEDTVLAHAIFRRAIDNNWRSVIAAFGNDYPDKKDIVGELAYLKQAQADSFARGMHYLWMNQ